MLSFDVREVITFLQGAMHVYNTAYRLIEVFLVERAENQGQSMCANHTVPELGAFQDYTASCFRRIFLSFRSSQKCHSTVRLVLVLESDV